MANITIEDKYNVIMEALDEVGIYVKSPIQAICQFNAQVCNGGLLQWDDNGYSEDRDDLLKALRHMGTDLAREVRVVVEESQRPLKRISDDRDDYEYGESPDHKKLEKLEEIYYLINETFMEEAMQHFWSPEYEALYTKLAPAAEEAAVA